MLKIQALTIALLLPLVASARPQAPGTQEPETQESTEVEAQDAKAPIKPRILEFPSAEDGLVVRADFYQVNRRRDAPLIVLFHQAGWSRGEYPAIATRLCKMGFNCIAVDQRSGGEVNGIKNETHQRAKAVEASTQYLDALPDMQAALKVARRKTTGPVIAWGSSYSAALVLRIAGTEPKTVDGVLSFAPGEYFKKKSPTFIQDGAKNIACPTFITSAKSEKENWKAIFEAIESKKKTSFLPKTKGNHGSRALWKEFEDSEAYWKEVTAFLNKHFPRPDESSKKDSAEPEEVPKEDKQTGTKD